jgi:hypothetical protein
MYFCSDLWALSIRKLSLGAIGSYVGRIFDEVRARPLYFIRSVQGQGITDQNPIPFVRHAPPINNSMEHSLIKTKKGFSEVIQ